MAGAARCRRSSTPAASSARTASASPVAGAIATATSSAVASIAGAARADPPEHVGGARQVAGRADAEHDARAADALLEVVRAALGDDPAVVDDRDMVGKPVGLLEVLGRQHERRAGVDEHPQLVPQLVAAPRVQAGRRLVEEQDDRVGDERRGEVEPAAHAARVGAGQVVGGVGEAEALEQLGGAGARFAPRHVVQARGQLEVARGR